MKAPLSSVCLLAHFPSRLRPSPAPRTSDTPCVLASTSLEFVVLACLCRYGDPAYKHKVLPGEAWRGRPAPVATMRVLTFDFFRKIVLRHDTGMGEAFMDQVGS